MGAFLKEYLVPRVLKELEKIQNMIQKAWSYGGLRLNIRVGIVLFNHVLIGFQTHLVFLVLIKFPSWKILVILLNFRKFIDNKCISDTLSKPPWQDRNKSQYIFIYLSKSNPYKMF